MKYRKLKQKYRTYNIVQMLSLLEPTNPEPWNITSLFMFTILSISSFVGALSTSIVLIRVVSPQRCFNLPLPGLGEKPLFIRPYIISPLNSSFNPS
jgi:hypothetical protein